MSRLTTILERLTYARKQSGLSQSQTAKLLNMESGATISHYESGLRSLTLEMFLRLCELYVVPEMWVLTGINTEFDPQPAMEALERMKASREDIDKVIEALAMTWKPSAATAAGRGGE